MNTATLITVVAGFVTLLLSIFGAAWLNQRGLERYIDAKFATVDARFAAVDARFGAVEGRLDRIERQLEAIFKPVLPH